MELKEPRLRIAIAGHPGVGKTTLARVLSAEFEVTELAGIHLLAPTTEAGREAYEMLLGRAEPLLPDAIVILIDATKLVDQLYLVGQLLDLRLPVVVGITHLDEARRQGFEVKSEWLKNQLLAPVLEIDHSGIEASVLSDAVKAEVASPPAKQRTHWRPSIGLGEAYNHLDSEWSYKHLRMIHPGGRLIEGLRLLSTPKAVEEYDGHPAYKALHKVLDEARQKMTDRKENWSMAEVLQRHQWANQLASYAVKQLPATRKQQLLGWAGQMPKAMGWGLIAAALAVLALIGWWVSA